MKEKSYPIWNKVPSNILDNESMNSTASRKIKSIWNLWVFGNVGWYTTKFNMLGLNRPAINGWNPQPL